MEQYRCETLTPKYEYGNSVEERSYDLQTRTPYLRSRTLHRIDESQRGGSGTPTPCSVGCPRRHGLANGCDGRGTAVGRICRTGSKGRSGTCRHKVGEVPGRSVGFVSEALCIDIRVACAPIRWALDRVGGERRYCFPRRSALRAVPQESVARGFPAVATVRKHATDGGQQIGRAHV